MRRQVPCVLAIFFSVVTIVGCSAGGSDTVSTPAAQTERTTSSEEPAYTDPFAYCAAVGSVDEPDAQYEGPSMPDEIVQGMIRLDVVSADAPADFQKNAVWRCMDGRVWVCHFGANIPCQEKADTSQEPSESMVDFCQANPTADVIPAAVTGRATVYEWACSDSQPQIVSQLFESDSQGYLSDFWTELPPE